MKNAVSYDRKMRQKARFEQKPLFAMAFDRRHIKGGAMIEYVGVGDDELIKDISDLIVKHTGRDK